jgi:hypothetical protein
MSHTIVLSPEVYTLVEQQAQQAQVPPAVLVETALRVYLLPQEGGVVDGVDYALLRGVLDYYFQPRVSKDTTGGLTNRVVASLTEQQERYRLVMAYYLDEAMSLERAAELLGMPWVALRSRFHRLGIPLRLAPANVFCVGLPG